MSPEIRAGDNLFYISECHFTIGFSSARLGQSSEGVVSSLFLIGRVVRLGGAENFGKLYFRFFTRLFIRIHSGHYKIALSKVVFCSIFTRQSRLLVMHVVVLICFFSVLFVASVWTA